jgi:hypothetical protein
MIHINNFVDKIKFFEAKQSKDFIFPLSEAKNLHSDITKLLIVLHELQFESNSIAETITNSEISGEDW